MAELVDRYLSDVAPVNLRPRTLHDHRQVARDHIKPVIGSLRVRQLEPADVQRMVSRMQARGYAPKTISNSVRVLSSILRHAMREGGTDRNVASLAVLPQVTRERLPSLTTVQMRAFLEATRGEPLWPVWVLAGTTALRVSEILGLRWRDVGETTLTISGQYRRVETPTAVIWQRVEPKTAKSKRTVYLPSLAREAIRVQRAQASSAVIVFARASGEGPLDRSWVTKRFAAALAAHGFPSVRLHSMRHTAIVSVLDRTSGDLRVAMEMAGHMDISTTVNVYGQDADAARKRAAQAMDEAMSPITARRDNGS